MSKHQRSFLLALLLPAVLLVSAFAGHEHIRALYAHAIERRYRFFSYGDAMLLSRRPSSAAA